MVLVIVCILIFSISWILTWVLTRYSFTIGLIDLPNSRSSHKDPTARGGGLAFAVVFLITILTSRSFKLLPLPLVTALIGAGGIVVILGAIDDFKTISPQRRLIWHFVASCFALYYLGGMPSLCILNWFLPTILINIFAVFYLVWLLNLYNFMDGINGLAAIETITVCFGGALLFSLNNNTLETILPLCLTFAVLGFLFWNFPTPRIFMGDSGSGFLGITLGIFSINAATFNKNFFWSWIILLGVFIVDASLTILRRAYYGENLKVAHNTHAYQNATKIYKKHTYVTFSVMIINILWLLPIAIFVGLGKINELVGIVIAYTPLVILALKFKAGVNPANAGIQC